MDQIDVLNEQLDNHQADNQKLRNLLGGGTNVSPTDFGWQIWLFTEARRIFPNTKLILNDYGLENDQSAINKQLNLLKVLRDRGIVDGFGSQAHCFNIDGMTAASLKSALDLMDNSGLPTYITELDLNGRSEDNANNGAVQSTSYQTHFPVYWDHPSVAGITLWGYVTNATWIGGTGLMSSTGVFKPAMTWLKDYVTGKPSVGYPICATGACIPTAIENVAETSETSAYPNPFTSEVTVSVKGDFSFQLITSTGQLVETGNSNGKITVGQEYPKGIYLLKVQQAEKSKIIKLIKE
jgi:hypothetical protein